MNQTPTIPPHPDPLPQRGEGSKGLVSSPKFPPPLRGRIKVGVIS